MVPHILDAYAKSPCSDSGFGLSAVVFGLDEGVTACATKSVANYSADTYAYESCLRSSSIV